MESDVKQRGGEGGGSAPSESPPPERAPESSRSAAEAGQGGGEPSSPAAGDRGVEEARREVEGLKDRLLRAQAEGENQRKRWMRERDDLLRFGHDRLAKEMLPVLDNLERALDHARASTDAKGLLEGVELTYRQGLAALEKFGVRPIEAEGKSFDPHFHEAMGTVEAAEPPPETIVRVIERGYLIHDRVLRPARVVVSRRPAPPDPVAGGDPPPGPGGEGGGAEGGD